MGRTRRLKCRHCRELFTPNHRNKHKHKHCSRPVCRKASKAASQKKWLAKEENKTYFSGPDNVYRVQQWRSRNPGYWKKRQLEREPLQDHLTGNNKEKQKDRCKLAKEPLQDLLSRYPAVSEVSLIGRTYIKKMHNISEHFRINANELEFSY